MPSAVSARRWSRFGATMALLTVLGLIDAGQWYVLKNYFRGTPIYWEQRLAAGLGDWYIWAAPRRSSSISAGDFRSITRLAARLILHIAFACGFMLLKIFLDLVLYIASSAAKR